jgi:hypothetical protein
MPELKVTITWHDDGPAQDPIRDKATKALEIEYAEAFEPVAIELLLTAEGVKVGESYMGVTPVDIKDAVRDVLHDADVPLSPPFEAD